ncbi:hydroxymethylbilane synthase [Flavihumibacter profundi]|uniref:hydroxymethylbilane synthase n=1 Tax=Flavihumibacter profundi TaxID=2716883 RepID=UPI001CC81223|nr:hydroxymethylbilane synthase [Flavihumibacter profundi]MBZ5858587.1 hydroxymethylbilane synthase [Flavihumibacter profundi]
MTKQLIRIGTRDSQLAVWQATHVQNLLQEKGFASELVMIKSDGDIDLVTPLYEMGVTGVFTKTLDAALLSNRIDIAVHSMKDVPTQMAKGIIPAAILERANYTDLLVPKTTTSFLDNPDDVAMIATSSIRRKAQWLNRYPNHTITNLRGNVNTRLRKLSEEDWDAAIFAAAGLERIGLRPPHAIELHWMLPAPAQGAILIVCREVDNYSHEVCSQLNHAPTAICTRMERDFLRTLSGGCATPISALATMENDKVIFNGNIFSPDGKDHFSVELEEPFDPDSVSLGVIGAEQLLREGAQSIIDEIRNSG